MKPSTVHSSFHTTDNRLGAVYPVDWLSPHSYRILGLVINNQNGQNSARETSARDYTLIERLSTCDSVGAGHLL